MLGRHSTQLLTVATIVGLSVACARQSGQPEAGSSHPPTRDAQRDAADAPTALDVEIGGCVEIARTGTCSVSPGTEIHLWIPGVGKARPVVTADGHELDAHSTEWPDGLTLTIVVPDGVTSLAVHSGAGAWSIPIVPAEKGAPAVEKAVALANAGKLAEAAALLEESGKKVGAGQSTAIAALARIEYKRGHLEEAVHRFHEAINLHDTEGRASVAADDAFALAFLLVDAGRFKAARGALSQAGALAGGFPEQQALGSYHESLLAWRTGNLRSALQIMRESERHAERIGAARTRRLAVESEALELLDLGRNAEALATFRRLLATDGDQLAPCHRADLLDNIGWAALARNERERGRDTSFDPREPLQQALRLLREQCPDANQIANALENIAYVEFQGKNLAKARAALAEARRGDHTPSAPVLLFALHLECEIARTAGERTAALAASSREQAAAEAFGTGDDQRVAAVDHAQALIGLGRRSDALHVLEAADALLEAGGSFIPLGEGKQTYFGTRDKAAMLRVRLLVELHRDEEAMNVGRQARARVLGGIRAATTLEHFDDAARAHWEDLVTRYRSSRNSIDTDAAHDWTLSSNHLAAAVARRAESASAARGLLDEAFATLSIPRSACGSARALGPGELELFYFPTDLAWIGFVRTAEGVRAANIGPVDPNSAPDTLAASLFDPFDAALTRAQSVHVLLYGSLRSVSMHALPWHGRPLLDHASVDYSLDLPATSDDAPSNPGRLALLVGDPTGDLPAARDEAAEVASIFATAPEWTAQSLLGTSARAESVRTALGGARLFHYAGHAAFGGADGIDSILPLAKGGKLTPGDVLALAHVPAVVSLFGCNSGGESESGDLDALGIANAFLAAGSQVVIATSRPIDDELARAVSTAYYRRLVAAPELPPSSALREALLATRERLPNGDWGAFRALVR